ncbi:MAG: hypothetical protein EOO99_10170 [Pedobacter sp.]|nr:MAG: hypothetical protein EOO99_10170 [Pedobacter sp.]
MEKFPFTTVGVEAFNLYRASLNQTEINIMAAAIQANFKSWLMSEFELSVEQVEYLNSLPTNVIEFLTFQCYFAVAYNLPMILIKPESRRLKDDPTEGSKLLKPKSMIDVEQNPEEGFDVSGELIVEISYEE